MVDRDSLNRLGIMSQCSKFIKSDSTDSSNLPDFIWTLRDYQYALEGTNPTETKRIYLKFKMLEMTMK